MSRIQRRKTRRLNTGTLLRVVFPEHLYVQLRAEAAAAAVTMADLVRLAVAERYGSRPALLADGDLRIVLHGFQNGLITPQELIDRLTILLAQSDESQSQSQSQPATLAA